MSLSTVPTQLKYGLVKKGGLSNAPPKVPLRPKTNAFKDALEDDSEDEEMSDIGRVNAQLRKKNEQSKIKQAELEASAVDTDIYDYDGSYDAFKAASVTSHPLSQPSDPTELKSKYVNSLLVTAKMRERETDRVYEKKLLKERKEEDELYGDQPKFVTNAYKQKLLEDQKWEYENKLAEQLEENTDVRKKGMHGFYANLLTKNIAMGGNVDNAVSVFTAGSNRQNQVVNNSQSQQPSLSSTIVDKQESSSNQLQRESIDEKSAAISEKKSELSRSTGSSNVNTKTSQPALQSVVEPEIHKTEVIDSAKERYLARKRKLQEEAGGH